MNKEIKKLWIKALRSGKYKQIMDTLRNNKGYCCLGVLRSVMKPGDHHSFGNENSLLTTQQRNKAGLRKNTCVYLANKNDEGLTFSQIADYIERRL